MEARRCATAAELLELAGGFLLAREAEYARMIGSLHGLADQRGEEADLLVVRDAGSVVAVGVRTPPYALQVSAGPAGAMAALADRLAADGAALPGVIGLVEPAAAFRDAWTARTGEAAVRGMSTRLLSARAVAPPHGVPGSLRPAARADTGLLVDWMRAFSAEAVPDDPTDHIPAMVRRVVGRDPADGIFHLWEVGGRVVSMAGTAGPTPHAIRVLSVYTPPDLRGRGYASACVAAVTQRELDRGRREVHLSTDLANPTSNAIYTAIGYRPVADEQVWRFSGRHERDQAGAR